MRFSRLALVAVLLVPIALLGCVRRTQRAERAAAPAPVFDHPKHVGAGLECSACHEKGGVRPVRDTCLTCHSDPAGPPTHATVDAILSGPSSRPAARETYGLIFDHARHDAAGVACATCHAADGLRMRRPSMSTCMESCHGTGKDMALDCAACHRDLDAAGKPRTHNVDWRRGHGIDARAAGRLSCRACHPAEDYCNRCHDREKPADHGPAFRTRGHGTIASFERERCATCHRQETCTRCHMRTQPVTHTSAWRSRNTFTHCNECHLPLTGTSCATCHLYFSDRHVSAAPAWPTNVTHVTGAACRTCHAGVGAGLNHPDNGDDCEACHAK